MLTRATVCGCAVAGCPSCACPSTWMREVLLAHPLAGDSRKRRSRDFDLKFKSGHLPRYKVRVFCPLLSRSCVRAYARHAQIEMPRPRCAHRCSAGTARFDGSLWGSFKALLGRPCCSWVCFGWLVRLDPADAGNRFSAGGCCMKLLTLSGRELSYHRLLAVNILFTVGIMVLTGSYELLIQLIMMHKHCVATLRMAGRPLGFTHTA